MALAALAQRVYAERGRRTSALLLIGIVGVALFYGDSAITPAISVLSAVEGLQIVAPSIGHLVLPVAATILALLFALQRFGTGRVGLLFGPIMLLWFGALAVAGLAGVVQHPVVLRGLSPTYAVVFVVAHPVISFIAMGAIVLVITGTEALYADLGHFGRSPIRRAWFAIVFPALYLNYLGQAALILRDPDAIVNPFFLLLPGWAQIPMVVLATAATVIASQAVISGAFSLSRQAMQLGLLPTLTVRQTSEQDRGQIYLPGVNLLLFIGVLGVTLAFGSSKALATAYGVSVTGALLVDTILLLVVARLLWHWRTWQLAVAGGLFGGLEATFLAANLSKVLSGGWVPLLIAGILLIMMTSWRAGRQLVLTERQGTEGTLSEFVERVRSDQVRRVPGLAVFPHPSKETTPLALRANLDHNQVLHEHVLIVSVEILKVPHVPITEAITRDDLGYADDGIQYLTIRFGFADHPHIPEALDAARTYDLLEPAVARAEPISYFVSRGSIRATRSSAMPGWRKHLFIAMAHNAANPVDRFGLPPDRTVTMGGDISI